MFVPTYQALTQEARHGKRADAVRVIKDSRKGANHHRRPPTPDPHDQSVSKRQWERQLMEWRQALKRLEEGPKKLGRVLRVEEGPKKPGRL